MTLPTIEISKDLPNTLFNLCKGLENIDYNSFVEFCKKESENFCLNLQPNVVGQKFEEKVSHFFEEKALRTCQKFEWAYKIFNNVILRCGSVVCEIDTLIVFMCNNCVVKTWIIEAKRKLSFEVLKSYSKKRIGMMRELRKIATKTECKRVAKLNREKKVIVKERGICVSINKKICNSSVTELIDCGKKNKPLLLETTFDSAHQGGIDFMETIAYLENADHFLAIPENATNVFFNAIACTKNGTVKVDESFYKYKNIFVFEAIENLCNNIQGKVVKI